MAKLIRTPHGIGQGKKLVIESSKNSKRFPWSEISEKEEMELLQTARRKGYKFALDLVARTHPDLATYVASELRIDWLFHCYSKSTRNLCLDLCSGWGGICFPLTKFFDEIVSLDLPSSKMNFQQTRAKEDGIKNIHLIRAGILSLPFASNHFDLIVANGVLQWAAFSRDRDPLAVQLDLLKEIRRCLKPGGCVYVGIENRFGLPYWTGTKDHTSLPFTSILPRKLADLVVAKFLKDQGWTRYDTYTHSAGAYESLLKEAGYHQADIFWTYPSYNYPKYAARLRDGNGYSFFAHHHYTNYSDMGLYKRIAAFIGTLLPAAVLGRILPLVWPNYLIFAWKDFRPETIEDAIAETAHAKSLLRMSGRDATCSKISFVALERGRARSFLKFRRCLQNKNLEAEEKLLNMHAAVKFTKESHNGMTFFNEEPVSGRPCGFHSVEDHQRAIRWLLEFQDKTAAQSLTSDDIRHEKAEIEATLSKVESSSVADEALSQSQALMNLLVSKHVPKCSEHGDFWPNNILISRTGKIAVLDWEFYKTLGNPIFDFCFFIINSSIRPEGEKSFYLNLLGTGPDSAAISKNINIFCTHKCLPLEAFLCGMPYVMSRCIVRHSIYSTTYSPMSYQYSRLLKLWNNELRYGDFSWVGL